MYTLPLLISLDTATSTDIKRAFSCGHLTVSHLHHSLSDKSVHANIVLGSWASIPDLVHESELVALFDPQVHKICHVEEAACKCAATLVTEVECGGSSKEDNSLVFDHEHPLAEEPNSDEN